MKINVEIDITPEELRRFLGLPDVQGFQQHMLESFTENITGSQDKQQEFVQNLFAAGMAPWQGLFAGMMAPSQSKKDS